MAAKKKKKKKNTKIPIGVLEKRVRKLNNLIKKRKGDAI